MVESKLVELVVAGSSPVGHPIFPDGQSCVWLNLSILAASGQNLCDRKIGAICDRCERSHNFHRTFRQGVEKRLAVLLGQNAVVQHHHDAGVGLGADQPADALAEFQNRLGQGKFAEGIAAARFNRLDAAPRSADDPAPRTAAA